MTRVMVIRLALTTAPLLLTAGAWAFRRPGRRMQAGILLCILWNAWTLLALNLIAMRFGWWQFDRNLPSFMGVAVEPWLGWTILWGAAVPVFAFDRPVVVTLLASLWLDLIVMPIMRPAIVLHPNWLWGEALAVLLALLPGLLLVRWTVADTRLRARVFLQALGVGGLIFWLIPAVAISRTGGPPLSQSDWARLAVAGQLLLIPVSLGVRAVAEFVKTGLGTPIPFDPPRRLVSSGPYAFVRNPMQVSVVMILLLGSLLLMNPWLAAGAVVAFAYGAGLADWHENVDLSRRFGRRWTEYRSLIRPWIPNWRPRPSQNATLFVAYSCSTCSSVGRWLLRRRPIGLEVSPAETAPDTRIQRLTYQPEDGSPSQGIWAFGRALEHIHLGWATVGWILMLPGIGHFAQLVVDVFMPGPGRVAGLEFDQSACEIVRVDESLVRS